MSKTDEAPAHTPGPWEVFDGREIDGVIGVRGHADIAYTKTKRTWLIDVSDEEALANAALIARAPEMADTITRLEAEVERLRSMTVVQETLIRNTEVENERLRVAITAWLDAINDLCAFEHHQPDNLGKEWKRLREAIELAEDKARAALTQEEERKG